MRTRTPYGRYAVMWLWLAVPIGLFGIYVAYGTPHLIIGYRFLDNGNAYDPWRTRHYTSCSFVSYRGDLVKAPAVGGKCPWVRFFKSGDAS